jgi:MFS family permease
VNRTQPSPATAGTALGTANGLAAIASSATAVALPALRSDLDAGIGETAWVFTAFALAFAATTLVYGRLADLVGARRPLQVGLAVMALGSITCALAPSLAVVVLGRVIQGAGAGAIPVLAAATLSTVFSGRSRIVALSRLGVVVVVFSASGPLIGGAVEAIAGWRAVMALPVLTLALIPFVERIAPSKPPAGGFDLRGALLTTAGVTGLVLMLQGLTIGTELVALGAALTVVGGSLLVRHMRRHANGIMPPDVVRNRALWWPALAGLAVSASYFAVLFAVPALLADRQGWSPLEIGLALLPAAAIGAVGARFAGRVTSRFGPGPAIVAGTMMGLVGVAVGAAAPGNPLAAVLALAGVSGGYGFGQPALLDLVSNLAAEGRRGAALGLFTLTFFFGCSVGSAIVGVVGDRAGLAVGLAAVLVLAPAGIAGAVIAARSAGATPLAGDAAPK